MLLLLGIWSFTLSYTVKKIESLTKQITVGYVQLTFLNISTVLHKKKICAKSDYIYNTSDLPLKSNKQGPTHAVACGAVAPHLSLGDPPPHESKRFLLKSAK